jgi:hypothetical protein
MGFFTDEKTGKTIDPGKLMKREKDEWIDALGSVINECFGAGKKQSGAMFLTSEADLKKMMGSVHNFKKRR